jgi:hypothetical protein
MGIMKSGLIVLAASVLTVASSLVIAAAGSAPASADSSPPGGTWGAADVLSTRPGLSVALPGISSLSCAAAGYCSAIGVYLPAGSSGAVQGMAVTETDGRWGAIQEIPGLAQLNSGGDVQFSGISCGAAGDCSAGGSYYDGNMHTAFVASQGGGTWRTAEPVAGVSRLGSVTGSQIIALSCPSAGDCTAVGQYSEAGNTLGVFSVSETNGAWGQAQAMPGLASSTGTQSTVTAVSCATAGNCSAGGEDDGGGWVANETGGVWSAPTSVLEWPMSISCPAPGYCAAVGSDGVLAVVADETAGVWGDAAEIPGTAALAGTGGFAQALSVSCSSAGNCAAAGDIVGPGPFSVFVVSEVSGNWGTASLVSGLSGPGGEHASVYSLSCGAAGYCTAGGYFTATDQGFVVSETAGTWAAAETLPGLAVAGRSSGVQAISCPAAGYCSAGGWQQKGTTEFAFVDNEATASATTLTVSAPKLTYGDENAEKITVTVNSPEAGTPTGTVAVSAGADRLCTITLTLATGTCDLQSGSLPGGRHDLTASYSGDSSYLDSQSPATAITIARAPSATSLTLSRGRVNYQHERQERLTVAVKLATGATPTGTVAVAAGHTTLCVITLRAGHGSCVLRNRQLKPGTRRIRAVYRGNADADPSDSAFKTLRIAR